MHNRFSEAGKFDMYTWKKENCLSEPENVSYKSLSGRLGETDLTSEIIEEPERASTL